VLKTKERSKNYPTKTPLLSSSCYHSFAWWATIFISLLKR